MTATRTADRYAIVCERAHAPITGIGESSRVAPCTVVCFWHLPPPTCGRVAIAAKPVARDGSILVAGEWDRCLLPGCSVAKRERLRDMDPRHRLDAGKIGDRAAHAHRAGISAWREA